MLAELSDTTRLHDLLLPVADPDRRAIRTALAATYDLASARIERVLGATIREITLQHPLFPVGRQRGTWAQTVPQYTHSELALEVSTPNAPVWVDLLVRLDVSVVAEVDPSAGCGARPGAVNQPYNAVIPAAGATSWGMVVNGQNQPVTAVSCALR